MMKDLDFDELDRAVNSLMEGVSKTPSVREESPEKVLTINPARGETSSPASPTVQPVSEPAQEVVPPVSPPAGRSEESLPSRRNAGRFMDVVHPSSDMKTQPRSISRQGVTITPAIAPSPASPAGVPAVDTSVNKQDAPKDGDHSADDAWPDPIDFKAFKPKKDVHTDVSTHTSNMPTTSFATDNSDARVQTSVSSTGTDGTKASELSSSSKVTRASSGVAPLVTPFLSDPKVEKRPLGAFAPNLHDVAATDAAPLSSVTPTSDKTNEQLDQSVNADADKQTPADPTAIPPPIDLPEELQQDVMAIESDETVASSSIETPAPQVETVSPSPVTIQQETLPASVAAASESSGPSSIPQQYREEPSTNDTSHAGIYDTETYHQPLAHPAKTKSGWMMVAWIILLLALGGGGAAALYYLGVI